MCCPSSSPMAKTWENTWLFSSPCLHPVTIISCLFHLLVIFSIALLRVTTTGLRKPFILPCQLLHCLGRQGSVQGQNPDKERSKRLRVNKAQMRQVVTKVLGPELRSQKRSIKRMLDWGVLYYWTSHEKGGSPTLGPRPIPQSIPRIETVYYPLEQHSRQDLGQSRHRGGPHHFMSSQTNYLLSLDLWFSIWKLDEQCPFYEATLRIKNISKWFSCSNLSINFS